MTYVHYMNMETNAVCGTNLFDFLGDCMSSQGHLHNGGQCRGHALSTQIVQHSKLSYVRGRIEFVSGASMFVNVTDKMYEMDGHR